MRFGWDCTCHISLKTPGEVEFVFEDQVRTLMSKRFNSLAVDRGRLFGIQIEKMGIHRRPVRITQGNHAKARIPESAPYRKASSPGAKRESKFAPIPRMLILSDHKAALDYFAESFRSPHRLSLFSLAGGARRSARGRRGACPFP